MRTVHLSRYGLVILLFLAVWNVGLAQDSLGMSCVSTLDYWGCVDGIQMVGDTVYVVSGNKFHIVSLDDPTSPVELGQASWSDYWGGMSVCVVGNLAYVNPGYGVIVYDISDPAHLVILADWQPYPGCEVEEFKVLGDIAIMKIIDGDLCIVDVSDLGNIHIIGGNFPPEPSCPVMPVGMVGEYLCLRGVGLSMWDISDPLLPIKVAEVDTQFIVSAATISGDHAYAGTWANGLRIINVSNPLLPFEVASCDSGNCAAVTVTGNHAIVSKSCYYLNIWNVENPTQPVFESTFSLPGSLSFFCFDLASSGSLVCGGDRRIRTPSLFVLDISNPQVPTLVGTYGTKGFLRRLAVSGTVGYIAGNSSALHTVDLSNPAEAIQLGMSNEELPRTSYDVATRGNYAYTACRTDGFLVFDISNPVEPDFAIAIDYPTDDIPRVVTAGDYAYVSDSDNHVLRIYSLADPAAPEYVNSINRYATLYCGFLAANEYLYFGIGSAFSVYSLSNPVNPQLMGSCNLSGGNYILDFASIGSFIYAAYEIGGLRVIDVSDPTNPTEVGSVAENTWSVAIGGNTLMTFGPDGLRAKDITDRLNPVTVGYYYYPNATDEWIRDIDILGQYLLTVSRGKFRVFLCDALSVTPSYPEIVPHEFALLPPYPNPFNSTLIIPFTLPIQSEATITIHNILGQKVHQFDFPPLSPGAHRVLWDASSRASGIYIFQMSADREFNQKGELLR